MTRILGAALLALFLLSSPAFAQGDPRGGALLDEDIAVIRASLVDLADSIGEMGSALDQLDALAARVAALEAGVPTPPDSDPVPPTAGLVAALCGLPTPGTVCETTFEAGTFPPFTGAARRPFMTAGGATILESELCCMHSGNVVAERSRSGNNSLKFDLRRGDPIVARRNRAEVLVLPRVEIGSEYWYGFSIFVPGDWVFSPRPVLLAQWTQKGDPGEPGKSPSLSLFIEGDSWGVGVRWDAKPTTLFNNPPTPDPLQGKTVLLTRPLEKGQWSDWVFRVKWSFGGDGVVQVWKDDVLIGERAGPNVYNDGAGPRNKFGLYEWSWTNPKWAATNPAQRRVIYYDEIRIAGADGSYSDVAPR